jgi:hypothetical protein
MKAIAGKAKELTVTVWVVGALFLLKEIFAN